MVGIAGIVFTVTEVAADGTEEHPAEFVTITV
jgi:hypothetical protein